MRRALPLLLSAATAVLIAAVCLQLPFANGPAEWEWTYRPLGLALGSAGLAAVFSLLIAWGALRWSSPRSLPVLIALGTGLTLALTASQPGGFGRVFESLASRNSFGYVFDAGLAPPARELLADYPRASAGLNQHSLTHPPGPLLLVRGIDLFGRHFRAAGPEEALRREVQRARDRKRPAPREESLPSSGTVAILALLLPAVSALAAWPLYRLALAWGLSPRAAFLAAGLWLFVPARSLFTPTLDQALPALLLAAVVLATPRADRPGLSRALASGGLIGLCCLMSYGYLATVPILAVIAASTATRRRLIRPAVLGVGFLLPWAALALFAGYDPWAAFRTSLALHHSIAIAPRSYGTWLVWNPYDFALLLGPAVLGLSAAALVSLPKAPPFRAGLWSWWGLLALLLAAGSVRGEVGRIWLMLMPFACLFAAAPLDDAGARPAGIVLLSQAALTLALAAGMVFVS